MDRRAATVTYTILFLNQKGGVGKTTLADELSFALERRGKTVAFISTDPQGGSIHRACNDPDYAESCDFQVVDTAGALREGMEDWCRASDTILIPMLPSTRDMEPTMRTLEIARKSGPEAGVFVVINGFYPFGRLDRELIEFLDGEDIPIAAKIPRTVALSQAASNSISIASYAPRNHAVPAIEELADLALNRKESNG